MELIQIPTCLEFTALILNPTVDMQYFYESEFCHGLIVVDRVSPWFIVTEIQQQLEKSMWKVNSALLGSLNDFKTYT